jgi:hypothetical protein
MTNAPSAQDVVLSPIVNVDVKMPRKMLHALGIFEAVSVVKGVEAVTEEQVRAFLTERHGADFAAKFKAEYLFSTRGT